MNRPPRDVYEALRDGGVPSYFHDLMLDWLDRRHQQLARSRMVGTHRNQWHLRWAYTVNDLRETLRQERGSTLPPPR